MLPVPTVGWPVMSMLNLTLMVPAGRLSRSCGVTTTLMVRALAASSPTGSPSCQVAFSSVAADMFDMSSADSDQYTLIQSAGMVSSPSTLLVTSRLPEYRCCVLSQLSQNVTAQPDRCRSLPLESTLSLTPVQELSCFCTPVRVVRTRLPRATLSESLPE